MGIRLALACALVLTSGCLSPEQAPPAPTASAVVQPVNAPTATSRTLLDEHFERAWPNDPRGTAWFTGGAYSLLAREPGQFVAIRAPIADVPPDVAVTGTLHKLGGPPGGGYGLIVRDQAQGRGDGVDQNGQYLVAAVGDRGEVGIWQRADSHWIDLLPWTSSAFVHPGTATNILKVQVTGNRLRFDVNGAHVADVEVGFPTGSVGLFVGGDLNAVQLDRLLVESASTNTGGSAAVSTPAVGPDISATRTRLTALTARAAQDSTVIQDADWRQQMAATLAAVEQIAGSTSSVTSTAPKAIDYQRSQELLGGIADDLASILGAFATGVDSPRNPINSRPALDEAAGHLQSATRQANQVLAEVEAARAAAPTMVPGR